MIENLSVANPHLEVSPRDHLLVVLGDSDNENVQLHATEDILPQDVDGEFLFIVLSNSKFESVGMTLLYRMDRKLITRDLISRLFQEFKGLNTIKLTILDRAIPGVITPELLVVAAQSKELNIVQSRIADIAFGDEDKVDEDLFLRFAEVGGDSEIQRELSSRLEAVNLNVLIEYLKRKGSIFTAISMADRLERNTVTVADIIKCRIACGLVIFEKYTVGSMHNISIVDILKRKMSDEGHKRLPDEKEK